MWLITSALGSTGSLIVVLSEILIVFLAFGVKEKYLKYLFCLSVVYFFGWLTILNQLEEMICYIILE